MTTPPRCWAASLDPVKSGQLLRGGVIDAETFERPIAFLKVDHANYEGRLLVTMKHYGNADFDALQVVIPDSKDRFPWDPHGAPPEEQPLLGEVPTEWRLKAPP